MIRILPLTLALFLLPAPPVLAAPASAPVPEEEKQEEKKKEDKEEKKEEEKAKQKDPAPRVFTNKDLEKYGKGGGSPRPPAGETVPTPAPTGGAESGAAEDLPPLEDRLDGTATQLALKVRERELEDLLAYLEGKEMWLKNPLGRPPQPPPGEPFLDPAKSGAEQLADTRERLDDTRRRLDTIRGLVIASERSEASARP